MTDPAPQDGGNVHEFTVSELSGLLKRTIEDRFGHVRLRGEISGFKRAASGHLYMSLKDERAVLDAVMWKGLAGALKFRPEDGLEVVVTGKLTTYPGRSKYQIVIEQMAPAGVGALMALLEQRRKALADEGLFDAARKRPLPFLPGVIGVVTSPTGAVIRDILHRLADRFPRHVLVWPVLVQGEGAAGQIAAAIDGFNRLAADGPVPRPDLLIVARGGGSLEDLWAFNEEVVVRAAAASAIPLISAVGHETDITLIDHAADRRAPTPTAAAEMAVPVLADLRLGVTDLAARLERAARRGLADRAERLRGLARAMPSLRDLVALPAQRVDDLADRLPRALGQLVRHKQSAYERISGRLRPGLLKTGIDLHGRALTDAARRADSAMLRRWERDRNRLDMAGRVLATLSYHSILARGYAAVFDADGKTVTRRAAVQAGDRLAIEFADGRLDATAGDEPGPRPKPAKHRSPPPKPKQGQLL
ncbi:MAG: exodeoxyribonuclease VII large subunit [Sphingomonadales bacterium]